MDSAFVVGKYTLLHVELVNKKVLLYSTENFIHSPEINHNGKEYFKYIYIYIYVKLSYFAVQRRLAQHCKSILLQFLKKKKHFIYIKEPR